MASVYIGTKISGFGGTAIRVALIACWCACAFSAVAEPARAEEEEIYFQSDYQREIQDEQILLLQGNVEVHFRDVVIYADEVRLNDEKDEFFGVGDVRLIGADRDIFADSIWYNYARDEFDMRNARGSMLVQNVGEPVWFEAERLKGSIDDYKMINGRVTTCTPDERREYHIEARSIKVLPGNKIIFRSGYFFILNVPVMWFPYWTYSLAETPWVIQAGKDSFRGVYVKTRYNYLAEELIVGALILEYYSRRGWLFGSDHSYATRRHGSGSIRWHVTYGTYRDTYSGTVLHANTYSVNLQHREIRFGSRFAISSFSFRASSDYNIARGRTNRVDGSLNTRYNTADARTSVNLTATQTSGASQSSRITTSLTHNRTLFENVTSSFKFDYKVSKPADSGPADEEFLTRIEFHQSRQGWNWRAIIDSHWDPDGFTNLKDRNRGYTDRLPEIKLTFQPNAFPSRYRNILGFQMSQLNLLGALYYIGPEKDEVQGFYGRLDTRFTRTDSLGRNHRLQSTVNYWQAISSTGDARYVYSTQVNWNWNITRKLRWQVGWNRTDSEGRIPMRGMDRAGSPSNQLRYSLSFQNGRLYTIQMSTTYNLRDRLPVADGILLSTKRLGFLALSFNYTPNRGPRIRISTRYDVVKGDFGPISANVSMAVYRKYEFQSTINLRPPGPITQFSTTATFIIGPNWDFHLKTEFARRASENIIREIQITYRLDCTFVAFQYRTMNDEWFINWGITGFPSAHLGYSTTEQAFGPGFFNTFGGTGSGFSMGGQQLGGGGW